MEKIDQGLCRVGPGVSLVNGSSWREFYLKRCLTQGDPLSPFLFILAADGLRFLTQKSLWSIGKDKVPVSHLQYADDVIFFSTTKTWIIFALLSISSGCSNWYWASRFANSMVIIFIQKSLPRMQTWWPVKLKMVSLEKILYFGMTCGWIGRSLD